MPDDPKKPRPPHRFHGPRPTPTVSRKQQHVEISVNQDVGYHKATGLDEYDLVHQAVPELNLSEVDTSVVFLKKTLRMPLIVTGMTGGYAGAFRINGDLASVCEERRLALGVGSQRQALEDATHLESYRIVRKNAPTIPIVGNIGAAQIVQGVDEAAVRRLVDLIEADALAIHLNALQEAVQREGDTQFKGLLKGIEKLAKRLPVPIVAKETGAGLSYEAAKKLYNAGVKIIDVSGAGGTSWSAVESFRGGAQHLARKFWDWGIPTAESIRQVAGLGRVTIIASGGLRDGIDIAKTIALGAHLGGMARPLLQILVKKGKHMLLDEVDRIRKEFLLAMFLTGSANVEALRKAALLWKGRPYDR